MHMHRQITQQLCPLLKSTVSVCEFKSLCYCFKQLCSTCSLIIIMVYPASNTDKGPTQNYPTTSHSQYSLVAPEQHQEHPLSGHSQDPLGVRLPRYRQLQIYWKKMLKHYIKGWSKRNNQKWPKLLKAELSNALVLIGDYSISRKTNVIKQNDKSSKGKSSCFCTMSPSRKSKDPSCLIVSPNTFYGFKTDFQFELTAINQHGKILYNAITLRSWQDMEKELVHIQKHLSVVTVLVQDKIQLMSIIPAKEFELRTYLENLKDLSDTISDPQIAKKSLSNMNEIQENCLEGRSNSQDFKLFSQGVQLFEFIKKTLLQKLGTIKKLQIGPRLCRYFSLAYNILWPLININSLSFQDQIQSYLPLLKKIFDKASKTQNTKPQHSPKPEHYPTTLENAHLCCSCKHKRGYIACLCCSMTEGKTVSLCLQCYGPYHYATMLEPDNNRTLHLLQKWENIEAITHFLVEGRTGVPQDPSKVSLKQEETL